MLINLVNSKLILLAIQHPNVVFPTPLFPDNKIVYFPSYEALILSKIQSNCLVNEGNILAMEIIFFGILLSISVESAPN